MHRFVTAAEVRAWGLDRLTCTGLRGAPPRRLPGVRGCALAAVALLAFGHGCGVDLFSPWIVQSLRAELSADLDGAGQRPEKDALIWCQQDGSTVEQGMSHDTAVTDAVTAGTLAYPARVFAEVVDWTTTEAATVIRMSDGSEWNLMGSDRIAKYSALLGFSKLYRQPIILMVDKQTQAIGMIFWTMRGVPEVTVDARDETVLQVLVPPSARVLRLNRDRTWFERSRSLLIEAEAQGLRVWIGYDSVSNEIVAVRRPTD